LRIIVNGVPSNDGPPLKLSTSLWNVRRRLFTFQPEWTHGLWCTIV